MRIQSKNELIFPNYNWNRTQIKANCPQNEMVQAVLKMHFFGRLQYRIACWKVKTDFLMQHCHSAFSMLLLFARFCWFNVQVSSPFRWKIWCILKHKTKTINLLKNGIHVNSHRKFWLHSHMQSEHPCGVFSGFHIRLLVLVLN